MCQICESPYRICQHGNTGFYINKMDNGKYRFKLEVNTEPLKYDISYSAPISYCPYCGRNLTTEFEPPTTYWEYLKSIDDSEAIRILLDLGKKWQSEAKTLIMNLQNI